MDFLNKAFTQLKDLFQGMTPGARITTGLLIVMVVVSLGYLFTAGISGPDVYLMDGEAFPPGQLRQMQAALAEAGLECETDAGRIRVPRGRQNEYMAALAQAKALPHNFGDILERLMVDNSPWMSSEQRRQRLRIAIQKELSLIIGSMEGIDSAAVLYDEIKVKEIWKTKTLITASVNVKPAGREPLDEDLVSAICHTVVGSVAGLKPEDVLVIDLNGGRSYHGNSDRVVGGSTGSYSAEKRKYQEQWKRDIEEVLAYVPGVIVTTNVELTPERVFRESLVKPNPNGLYRKDRSLIRPHAGAPPAGRPGAAQNAAMSLTRSETRGSSEDEEGDPEDPLLVGSTQTEKENAPHTPKRVTASIAIPSSYLEKVWRQRNPPADGQEPKTPEKHDLEQVRLEEVAKIKGLVANKLPPVEGVDDLTELVQVAVFPDIPPNALPEPGFLENAATWLGQHWATLGLIALAAIGLLVLRSMVKAPMPSIPRKDRAETAQGAAEGEERGESDEKEVGTGPRPRRAFNMTSESLRDDLSDLVTEDPDTAANILRDWIGSASNSP